MQEGREGDARDRERRCKRGREGDAREVEKGMQER